MGNVPTFRPEHLLPNLSHLPPLPSSSQNIVQLHPPLPPSLILSNRLHLILKLFYIQKKIGTSRTRQNGFN